MALATVGILTAAHASVDHAAESGPLSAVVAWVKKTGARTVIRGNVAKEMKLGNEDIGVRERGFRSTSGGITHVLAVGSQPQFADVIFIARVDETTDSSIVWRTSSSGRLELTVNVDPVLGVKLVSNAATRDAFVAEKQYFFGRMNASDDKSNESGADTDDASQ
jgi:hypothetical protein